MKKLKIIGIVLLVLLCAFLVYVKFNGFPKWGKGTDDMEIVASGGSASGKPVEATVESITEHHTRSTEPKDDDDTDESTEAVTEAPVAADLPKINGRFPAYTGEMYCTVDDNVPHFDNLTTKAYIHLSELDSLGRCQVAEACLGKETMPKDGEERGEIGMIKPSGWKQKKYEGVINSKPEFIWNRTHVLMWALTSINAEERNLVTGTRYMNVNMTGHELLVVKYIEDTGNHVMYRVTPIYEGEELVCRGLEMEAKSVEDDGVGISYHVFYYNVQPGIEINYKTGESRYNGIFLDTKSETVVAPEKEEASTEDEETE